jgi:hypothetical protein
VVHAGLEPERGGHEQDRRTLDGQRPVRLGEPEVVADGQADAAELGLGGHDLVPGREDGRLAARDRSRRVRVEQVDLPVGRDELARAIEQHARVEDVLAVAFEDASGARPLTASRCYASRTVLNAERGGAAPYRDGPSPIESCALKPCQHANP